MNGENRRERLKLQKMASVLVVVLVFAATPGGQANAGSAKIKIFDDQSKTIVVNGYSTSFGWPRLLQEKLDRKYGGKRVLTVKPATKGGTPIAKWIDVKTGEPSRAWRDILRPKLAGDGPTIVLAQQSLQWVFGDRTVGIGDANDKEHIKQGADALEKYVRLLKKDGADLVFVAMHIYKHPMEPEIGNERLALTELINRKIPYVQAGPDVWTPTKAKYPQAFARDKVHPNDAGAEIMAQKWFETLLKYDEHIGAGQKTVQPARRPGETRAMYERRIGRQRRERQGPGAKPNANVSYDIEYVRGGHQRQKLDLYIPKKREDKPLPLIIWIHGGAWRAGSKDRCPATRFLDSGYAVASINYRLSQHAIFPAQIEDCKAAIRYLRANAERYDCDPERFGVWGSSAGGHLVALVGTTGDVKEFDKGENLDVSSRVQAVCDFYGPTDFTLMNSFWTKMDHDAADSPESKLIGGPIQQNKEKCQRANPMTYISKEDPAFLIVHGDKDPLVAHNQSVIFDKALREAGVPVKFHTVAGGGHGGFKDPAVDKMVEDFFAKQLKPGKKGPAGRRGPASSPVRQRR